MAHGRREEGVHWFLWELKLAVDYKELLHVYQYFLQDVPTVTA
jgi:hypothetical protein